MGNSRKQDEWLQDVEARQRSVVFPDTVQNEARFWRNLSERPLTITTRIGLALLALLGWGLLVRLVFAVGHEGVIWPFIVIMLLIWGPIFLAISWATRRALRNAQNARRGRH